MNKMKVSDLVAEFLEKHEIKTIFGIIGSANSHIFDSITKRGYTQIICVHHEQAAVMAAGAYFRTSGKLSAALVTAGAGSSNAITGVISNWADSIPCLIISGQEQTFHLAKYEGMRMYGIQGFSSTRMVKEVTKYSKTILNENEVQNELEQAIYTTLHGRPGPVWLDFPFDLQAKTVEPREWNHLDPSYKPQFDAAPVIIENDLNYVMECLQKSERPVIWGGHGIRIAGARDGFKKLVRQLQVPTILTWSGIDLLEEHDSMYFGRAGVHGHRKANFIIQNSDFILAIGTRLSLLQAGYDIKQFSPKAKIVLVNIDTEDWYKYRDKYDRFIQMDCKFFIQELYEKSVSCMKPDWMKYCLQMNKEYPTFEIPHHNNQKYINSYWFVERLNEFLRDDEIIVTDMGTGLLSGHYSIKIKPNQTMFTSLGLGEMGYGLPGAIGAAFAGKGRQVLCLNCDGGMMMNLQELQTIKHHNLPIKIIVFNNDGYLMIKHTQKLLFNGDYNSVDAKTGLSLPDYSKVGHAFGFKTMRLEKWMVDEGYFKPMMNDFFGSTDPAILEVFMDPEQPFIPKVKGVPQDGGNIVPASLEEMSPLLPYEKIVEAMPWALNERSKTIKRV